MNSKHAYQHILRRVAIRSINSKSIKTADDRVASASRGAEKK